MNILDALKQLRDDIKTWATNNFKALETKIEESTLPIDETLDSTSSNPIQNKAVAEEITSLNNRVGTKPLATQEYVSTAISDIPKPDLTGYATETFVDTAIEATKEEMGQVISSVSKDLQVVDEAGNIVFKVDENGVQTTEVTLGGKTLSESLDEKALKNHQHTIKNTSTVLDTGTIVSFEIEGQTFSQEVAIDGGSMSVESAQRLTTGRNIALTGDVVADNVVFDGSADIVLTTTVKNSEKLSNRPASEYALKTDIPDTKDFITMSDVEEKQYLVEADITAKKFVDESSLAAKQYATESFVADELDGLTEDLKQSILLESNEWQVVDENNNIIFKVDAEGTHTTAVTIDGEAAATEAYVDEAVKNVKVDLTDYPTRSEVEGIATELKQSILLESQDWQVVDSDNNVILSVDSDGLHTTNMTLDGESAATEKFVADSIAAIEFPETDLSNYYTKQETESLIPDTSNFLTEIPEEYVTETELTNKGFLTEHQSLDGLATIQELEEHTQNSNLHVTSADKQKWDAKSNFSGDYNDLTNAPAIAEDETGDLIIADNAGNIIFRASDQGLETTHLSIGSLTINGMTIQEIVNACVEEALKNQNN